MSPIDFLLTPLSYTFMQRGMLAVILVGAISGVLGCYIVVRGMAFFGDALAHSIMPGVAVAYIAGGNLFLGGLMAGVIAALGIGWLTRGRQIKEDTAIGIVFAGMLALGVAIISTARSYSADLSHILFGNVLGVGDGDLWAMVVLSALVIGVVLLFYKEFLVLSFDPGLAQTLRLPGERLRLLLLALIAVTIVASLQTVGVALMVAMLVTPAATAQLVVKRLHHMMIVAAIVGAISGAMGLYASYYLNVASGAAIVLTTTAVFGIVLGITRLRERRRKG